jgi:putative membrane protein
MIFAGARPPVASISWSTIASGWNFEPQIVMPLVLTMWLYAVGVHRTRQRRGVAGWKTSRSVCFLAGGAVLFLALASPIDAYSGRLLSVHMVQHLLLMQVAPPLLLLGRPITLALAASSGTARARLSAFAQSGVARTLGSPVVCFGSFAVVLWASHLTPLYEVTLTDRTLHALEHLGFLTAALLFWWPIVARDPGAARMSHPGRLFYLFLSMPVMSLLGFVISSSDRVLYAHYVTSSDLLGVSALADQRLGGTIMWESSMLVSAVALSAVLLDWMERDETEGLRADLRRDRHTREHHAEASGMNLDVEGR